MSATMSFLQRVVAAVGPAVGPAAGAGLALRAAGGPLALGRFLRRRWMPSLRSGMTLARAAEDEDPEEQQPEAPASSAPSSVQTVRRAPALRRAESSPAADVEPQLPSDPEPGGTAPLAQLARAEGAPQVQAAARNAPRDLPASRAAPAAAPSVADSAAPSAASPVRDAERAGLLPEVAESSSVEISAPAGERVLRPDAAPLRAIALPSGAAAVAARAAVADAGPSRAAPSLRGEAAVSFTDPARLELPHAPAAVFAPPGQSAAAESALPEGRAAGEPQHVVAQAEYPRHVRVDAGPGRALPEPRDEIRTAEPLVQIGSIEIIIEAAAEPPPRASAPAAAPDFTSRFYVRGL